MGSLTFYYDSFDQYIVMVLLIHLLPVVDGAVFSDPQCMPKTAGQSCPLPSLWVHTCGGTDGRNQVQGNTVSGVDHSRLLWGSSVLKHTEGEEITSRAGQHGVVCPQAASV